MKNIEGTHGNIATSRSRWVAWIGGTTILLLIIASPILFANVLVLGSRSLSRWQNRDLIRQSYDHRLMPAATWVRAFIEREHRLPTQDEVRGYSDKTFGGRTLNMYSERPDWLRGWGVAGRDFLLCDSIAKWTLAYCSWDDNRIEIWRD